MPRGKEKDQEARRQELASFLRGHREKITPPPGKFGQLSRRRTPGLRREELAEIAGIGTTWYTWLEQAREIEPSSAVLERIGRALELNAIEMQHLFHLAGRVAPATEQAPRDEVPASLKLLIDTGLRVPVIVLSERYIPLHWNEPFRSLIADPADFPAARKNWLLYVLTEPAARQRIVDWESLARRLVAEFRADVGDQIGRPWVMELIARLKKESPEFGRFWKAQNVQSRASFRIMMEHPDRGPMLFQRSTLVSIDAPKLKMLVFTPIDGVTKPRGKTAAPKKGRDGKAPGSAPR